MAKISNTAKRRRYHQLKALAVREGACAFGVADLRGLPLEPAEEIKTVCAAMPFALSIGAELSAAVLRTIGSAPTLIYSWHYRQMNTLLDHIALCLSRRIQAQGFQSLPVAASQVVDWTNQKAHLSHKHLAAAAGLGWIGRNNLLVNRRCGSRLRLVSVLTDMPLAADKPCRENCGTCAACAAVCPAAAIKKTPRDFDHQACYEKLKFFSRMPGIKYHICGACVRSCLGNGHGRNKKS